MADAESYRPFLYLCSARKWKASSRHVLAVASKRLEASILAALIGVSRSAAFLFAVSKIPLYLWHAFYYGITNQNPVTHVTLSHA